MRDIWLISDTHFNHENILKFCRPEFESVSHMNETIINNWNRVVKPGDKVYHLGDVFFGSKEDFKSLWPRLNGKKRLVVGNHDDIKFLSSGGFFSKVYMWRIFKEFDCVLTHVPINEENFRKVSLNIHGHTHEKGSPKGPYKSVCCELINYTPVNIESFV
jgi:calcineurin-like phosphoesterase family protein